MAESIKFEYWNKSPEAAHEEWKNIIELHLKLSKTFEIHCWKDELEEIKMALVYGKIKCSEWRYGTVITGDVTPMFIDYLLSLPKPAGNDMEQNRMTPFFTIALNDGFWSEHYGTELNQE